MTAPALSKSSRPSSPLPPTAPLLLPCVARHGQPHRRSPQARAQSLRPRQTQSQPRLRPLPPHAYEMQRPSSVLAMCWYDPWPALALLRRCSRLTCLQNLSTSASTTERRSEEERLGHTPPSLPSARRTNQGDRYHATSRSNGKRPLHTMDCPMLTKETVSPYKPNLTIPNWTTNSGHPPSQHRSPSTFQGKTTSITYPPRTCTPT